MGFEIFYISPKGWFTRTTQAQAQAQAQEKVRVTRKEGSTSVLVLTLLLASPGFTRAFSCACAYAYACIVRVNRPKEMSWLICMSKKCGFVSQGVIVSRKNGFSIFCELFFII